MFSPLFVISIPIGQNISPLPAFILTVDVGKWVVVLLGE